MTWLDALETSAREGCAYIMMANRKDFALLDEDVLESMETFRWNAFGGYAVARTKDNSRKSVRMHRLIASAPMHLDVDHQNRRPLDNRKSNLRCCTTRQNLGNAVKQKWKTRTSDFKGVSYRRDMRKWLARGTNGDRRITLGYFQTQVEAARAYNRWAVEYFGEFALLNDVGAP